MCQSVDVAEILLLKKYCMTKMPNSILHLPKYQVLNCKSTDDEMHFQVDAPNPITCEECGVQGQFVRFGKRVFPIVICPSTANGSPSGWSVVGTPAGPARPPSGPSYRRWWTASA